MIVLATVATIIASQSIITGAFSMTRQAIQLGWLPRLPSRRPPSARLRPIYVGTVNWLLMIVTLVLTIGFRSSPDNLAAAYGVAVSAHHADDGRAAVRCAAQSGAGRVACVAVTVAACLHRHRRAVFSPPTRQDFRRRLCPAAARLRRLRRDVRSGTAVRPQCRIPAGRWGIELTGGRTSSSRITRHTFGAESISLPDCSTSSIRLQPRPGAGGGA